MRNPSLSTGSLGISRAKGGTLNNIGVVYKSRGQYQEALEYYERSLAIKTKLGDVKGEGFTLTNIGANEHVVGPVSGKGARQLREGADNIPKSGRREDGSYHPESHRPSPQIQRSA